MSSYFSWLAVAAAVVLLVSACDSKTPEPPAATPVAAAEPPPPPPPMDAATALAAVKPEVLCGLFGRAMSDAKTKVAGADCVITPATSEVTVASKDGAATLVVPIVEPGVVVQLSQANTSPRAVATEQETFANIGMVMIGKAPASGLCVSVEAFAPAGDSNSIFVGRDPRTDGAKVDLVMKRNSRSTTVYDQPVIPPNQIAAFAVTRREEKTGVKSLTFRPC